MTGYTRSAIANVETGRSTQPRNSWRRYDEVLKAGGALVAISDQYATLAGRYRQQAAQERERQRTAKINDWQVMDAVPPACEPAQTCYSVAYSSSPPPPATPAERS